MRAWLPLSFVIILMAAVAAADTYVVRPDGAGDFPSIQAAVDAAAPGDVVELTDGVFTGAGNRGVDLLGKAVTIRSQSGDAAACVIDCQYGQRGFFIASGEGPGTVIENLTVIHGDAPGEWPDNSGGAVYIQGAAPVLCGCVFAHCRSIDSGAVAAFSGAQPAILDCRFEGNQAAMGGALGVASGSLALIEGCSFAGNSGYQYAGGLVVTWSTATVRRCTFVDNTGTGAGVYCHTGGIMTLENTIVAFNLAGEGVYVNPNGTAALSCCCLYGNEGGDWVGPIADQAGAAGNLEVDPLLCRDENPEQPLALRGDSPCAAQNNAECGRIGAWDVGCMTTAAPDSPRGAATRWGAVKSLYE